MGYSLNINPSTEENEIQSEERIQITVIVYDFTYSKHAFMEIPIKLGPLLIEELKKQNPHKGILILSGFLSNDEIKQAVEMARETEEELKNQQDREESHEE